MSKVIPFQLIYPTKPSREIVQSLEKHRFVFLDVRGEDMLQYAYALARRTLHSNSSNPHSRKPVHVGIEENDPADIPHGNFLIITDEELDSLDIDRVFLYHLSVMVISVYDRSGVFIHEHKDDYADKLSRLYAARNKDNVFVLSGYEKQVTDIERATGVVSKLVDVGGVQEWDIDYRYHETIDTMVTLSDIKGFTAPAKHKPDTMLNRLNVLVDSPLYELTGVTLTSVNTITNDRPYRHSQQLNMNFTPTVDGYLISTGIGDLGEIEIFVNNKGDEYTAEFNGINTDEVLLHRILLKTSWVYKGTS